MIKLKMANKIYFPDLYVEKSRLLVYRLNMLGISNKEFARGDKINIKKL